MTEVSRKLPTRKRAKKSVAPSLWERKSEKVSTGGRTCTIHFNKPANRAKVSTKSAYEILDLKIDTTKTLIKKLHEGFQYKSYKYLVDYLEISNSDLSQIVGINNRTLTRRKSRGRFDTDESERILRVAGLLEHATSLFKDKDKALNWLKSPKKALDGKSPLEYADTSVGIEKVNDLLGRLEYGVYT